MKLLDAIQVAADLGVGTGEPEDSASKEYDRACMELIVKLFLPNANFSESMDMLRSLFDLIPSETA